MNRVSLPNRRKHFRGGGILPGNLLGRWPFIGNANDTSGNGNSAITVGSEVVLTTDEDGHANHAYDFNYDNVAPYTNFIEFPGSDFRFPNNIFTMHIKLKPSAVSNVTTAFTDVLTTHDGSSGWTIERDNETTTFRFIWWDDGLGPYFGFNSSGVFTIPNSTYTDLMIVNDGTTLTVYIANVSVASYVGSVVITTNTNNMLMGALDDPRSAHHLDGVVDGFQIWDTNLDATQRAAAIALGFEG